MFAQSVNHVGLDTSPFPTGNDCEFAERFAKNALLLPARRGRRALRVGGCGFAGCLLKAEYSGAGAAGASGRRPLQDTVCRKMNPPRHGPTLGEFARAPL